VYVTGIQVVRGYAATCIVSVVAAIYLPPLEIDPRIINNNGRSVNTSWIVRLYGDTTSSSLIVSLSLCYSIGDVIRTRRICVIKSDCLLKKAVVVSDSLLAVR